MRKVPAAIRFWAKVDKTETCWLWTGGLMPSGYGGFNRGARGQGIAYAHRFAYELVVGLIPQGMQLDHICRVRRCVRPDHLRPVTAKQNLENSTGGPLATNRHSGIRGVHRDKDRWAVAVSHNGQRFRDGNFVDLAEAEQAAIALRNRLFTHNEADRGDQS